MKIGTTRGLLFLVITIFSLLLVGCQPDSCKMDPIICYPPSQRLIEKLPSPFPPMTTDEFSQEWGKELFLGRKFARELDLYRALTCFKSALFLVPSDQFNRIIEIEYEIFLAYYLGNKYQEAIDAFETSHLVKVSDSFPALHDLLIALYDAYMNNDQPEKGGRILCLIAALDNGEAIKLKLETAIIEADFPTILNTIEQYSQKESIYHFLDEYNCQALSVSKAQTLNAVLPGAGYWYVGQQKAAITSFVINALFIAASYQLFDRGYIPAAIITTSLEIGWYFGGINGAGLAAREYNDRLYERIGGEVLMENRLFPVLMLQMSF